MTVTYIEIDSDQRDTTLYTNPYTFDISTNTSSSTAETGQLIGGTPTTRINARQYEVQLQELTIPLSNLSFLNQPYLYVKFENSRSVDNSHFYSNNKSSAGKYFRVPLDNKLLQTNSVYATFKSNMTQIMNLSLQENLTFDIRLPQIDSITNQDQKVTPTAINNTVYNTDVAVINSTSFNLTSHPNTTNFSIGSTIVFGDQVTITITNPVIITLNGHGLSDNDQVSFFVNNNASPSLPSKMIVGTTYFVVFQSTNTFHISTKLPKTVTITIATPGEITWVANGLSLNDSIVFHTTTTLPTGITAGTTYYVKTILSNDKFTISASSGGVVINTSGTQSGTHSASLLVNTIGGTQVGDAYAISSKLTTVPSGTYTVTSIDSTTGLMGIYPKLNTSIHGDVVIKNTSDTIDRVTALFELKQIVKY